MLIKCHKVLENTCMQKPSPSDKTIVFSEHEVTKAVVLCFSRNSPFPAELCIAERQLDLACTDFQIYDVF
jgi:hypothetical protein